MILTIPLPFSCVEKYNLGGGYVFDISEDSVNYQTGEFTYVLTSDLADGLNNDDNGSNSINHCSPSLGCNVCHSCCKFYLTNQRDCNACVITHCHSNQN